MARRKRGARRTLVALVVDKSGSMSARRAETIDGYNEYLTTLRDNAEGEVLVTLTQFDTRVEDVYASRKVSNAPRLTNLNYVPGGMTALYDAVGRTVRDTERAARKDDNVLLVVMTDGQENSSREWRHDSMLRLLEDKRRDGWETIFLGAGEESWAAGRNLGFGYDQSINYGSDGVSHRHAFNDVALASAYMTQGISTQDYLASSTVKAGLEADAGYQPDDATLSKGKKRQKGQAGLILNP